MKHEYGKFGGQYVPEGIKNALEDLKQCYEVAVKNEDFKAEYIYYLKHYVGRPSPLYYSENLSQHAGGAKIYLKREDLNHTGAHKINNAIGQILLAKRMGKKKIIAETGAGQHGVATATAAAMFGMSCEIYMGAEDVQRQSHNVHRMELLGAKVHKVTRGTQTLSDAVDAALEAWVARVEDTFYLLGSAVGPSPYPEMVRYFQKIIGEEAKKQILKTQGTLPEAVIACVGGGSNAIGIFADFMEEEVKLIGVEAAGKGLKTQDNAATLTLGKESVIHGMRTIALVDENQKPLPVYSISAGLDYPGVGPEHAHLKVTGRASYVAVTDQEAVAAFKLMCKMEGIIPAIESSHAIAYGLEYAKTLSKDQSIIINLSGRGDKDIQMIEDYE